jgi:excinuclease UvrABC nuclease subunit
MFEHAQNLEFEEAARVRDQIKQIEELNMGLIA